MAARHPVKKFNMDFDFQTDPDFQDIREKILRGEKVPHCADCYKFDDGGVRSSRIFETQRWMETLGIDSYEQIETKAIFFDLRNDNQCNLACRMCGPQCSTQLEKEYKEIGWASVETYKDFGFNNVVALDDIKRMYVAGGEPSIMFEFRKFLRRAVEEGKTDFDLRLSTNGTNLNKEYYELLKNFKKLHVTFSLDGYGDVNKYIRWPCDWNTLISNIKKMYELTQDISFNTTISIWNISQLSNMIIELEKEFEFVPIMLNRVTYPRSMEFTTFPDKDVALADLEKIKETRSYKNMLEIQERVHFYISEMANSKLDIEALREFFEYNDALDKSRGIQLANFIPELEHCRRHLTTL